MATDSSVSKLLIIFSYVICFCFFNVSHGRTIRGLPIRAVNLGGWLVTEGWIKPSLFDAIPNRDFLDGTQLQFRSVTIGKYLCAESGGGSIIVVNRTSASGWESFRIWRKNENSFHFRVFNKQFVGLDKGGNGIDIVAVENTPSSSETFQIVRNANDPNRVRIKAPNGFFLQAETEELVSADSKGNGGWGDDDPSVFLMTIGTRLRGEYQLTNGYGPTKALQILKEHWSTYIVENDFKFISKNGLNSVRIPIGWWIARDPTPPKPYVGGSLKALDNAFLWARKYGIKVILNLHAAPGSQNGFEHSSSRDGFVEWGQTADNIKQTINVIDFLTGRYAKNPSLFAVELINEPLASGVSLETVTKFYRAGYDAVRKHTQMAYVVLGDRLGSTNVKELFPLASEFSKSVVDVHYYNLYSSIFDNLTVEQNIEYVYKNRTRELNDILTANNAPLVFIGEWTGEWQVRNARKEDYQRYAKAQLEVFRRATLGWAYWTLKNVNRYWSMEWMIKNGYIKL